MADQLRVSEDFNGKATPAAANFTDTRGTTAIVSNNIGASSAGADAVAYSTIDLGSNDHWCQGTLVIDGSATSGFYVGICIRMSTSAQTFYKMDCGSGTTLRIVSSVAGAETVIGTFANTFGPNTSWVLRLEAIGPTINGYLNGTLRITVATNVAVTDGTKAGVNFFSTPNQSTAVIDDFTAGDFGPKVTFVAAGAFAGNITVATQAITAPACNVGDILICALINKSVTANTVTPPDGTWTAVTATAVNNCTLAADDHQYSLYWKRATASGGAFTFTKATSDSVLFGGVICAYRGAVAVGSPLDATAAAVTATIAANDSVFFPAYDPVSTNNRMIYVAYYGNDLTTFSAAMSADTNPDCTIDVDTESSLGTDCSIGFTSGTNDGSSVASRTWVTTATTDAGNTGVVFALVAQVGPFGDGLAIGQAVRRAAVR